MLQFPCYSFTCYKLNFLHITVPKLRPSCIGRIGIKSPKWIDFRTFIFECVTLDALNVNIQWQISRKQQQAFVNLYDCRVINNKHLIEVKLYTVCSILVLYELCYKVL